MVSSRPFLLAAVAAAAAACSSVHDDLSRQMLQPPPAWLAEPADAGLTAEPVEVVLHSTASITGWWIPHPSAQGRTVVLFHSEDTNTSVLHPYYTFLHAAGFQVLVFDPRGFGRSKGTPSIRAWFYDLPELFDWLRARPDVDPAQVVFFGTGFGSIAALWSAMTQHNCKALVLEHLPSLRDILRESQQDDGSALSAYALGMVEFAGLPEGVEPDENAPKVRVPALFLAGELEPARDRKALLRAYNAYSGPRQLRVFAGTARAPHAMLTHDAEYQRSVVEFLRGVFAGRPERAVATWQRTGDAGDGTAWYEIQVTSEPATRSEPWAIEACAVLADGSAHYARAWLEGERAQVRLKLPAAPAEVTAVRVYDVLGDDEGSFRPKPTHLARSGAAIAPLAPRLEELRNGKLSRAEHVQLALDLRAAEAAEPFHPRLAAELSDAFALLGKSLATSDEAAQRAEGRLLLQRAVDSAPKAPKLHVWPGTPARYGFPGEAAVDEARRMLSQPAQ